MYDPHYLPSRAKRTISKSSKMNFVGQLTFLNADGKSQAFVFNSLLECHACLCLLYRPDFVDIEEQPEHIMIRKGGRDATPYWYDFRVTFASGARFGISVKPWEIAQTWKYEETIKAARNAAVPSRVDRVFTITERNIKPDELARAKQLHAARHPREAMDERVFTALPDLSEPTSVGEFLRKSGIGEAGFWSVVRAVKSGLATVVEAGCITLDTTLAFGGRA